MSGIQTKAMLDAMRPWQLRMGIVSGFGIPIAGLLLAGGIGLLYRQAWSRSAAVLWAALKIMLSVVLGVVVYFMQRDQFDAMVATPGMGTGRLPAAFGETMGLISLAFTAIWGSALPVFVLAWFARPTILGQIAGWRTAHQSIEIPPSDSA